ncbi:SURF1 family cytochrome oxidase biogenesis protein [Ornithinimicrobium panacihumi]|uniref:SURF1 family cytochrome oxidase biogenesis protein n=1 Tax=Ornithinimicrobium panacihumi TaxID=2008449 RepID=UPI003F89B3FA
MFSVLRRPRWLLYLVLAVVFGIVATLLGLWQWTRHEEKVERREVVEANYFGDPVPLEDVLAGPEDTLGTERQWTRVSATGTYAPQDQLLVRNRPHQGVFGYEVLVPLHLPDGSVLTVDRGWVRNAEDAATLPDVPPAPEGEITVTGWLRPSERDLGRDLPEGQLASIDLPRVASAIGADVHRAFLVLETEDPAAERPAALEPPDTGLGSHFAYAIQWWLTVPVGLILVLVMARQTARDEDDATGGKAARPPRPKKTRIWDEEDY